MLLILFDFFTVIVRDLFWKKMRIFVIKRILENLSCFGKKREGV